jgi:hypothetical protein
MDVNAEPTNEIQAQFDQLQRKLEPLWQMIGRTDPGGPLEEENTIVVMSSLTTDIKLSSASQQSYEERFLFMLFLLRQPNIRMIYLTSQPVQPAIIDYYLQLVPSVVASQARKRLFMVSPDDSSAKPLVVKILARPNLLQHIRDLIHDPERAHLVPFFTTDLERELAVRLNIPMYAAVPRFFALGTKCGCRRIFAEEGVLHPLGYENLAGENDLALAITRMRSRKPSISKVIVKLNDGVSGFGNAGIDLSNLPVPGDPGEYEAVIDRLHTMTFELPSIDYEWYRNRLEQQGGIVEERIAGDEVRSPSAQLRVTPLGEVEQLSTHDQILGGPSGQIYLGARFPADPDYAPQIMQEARKIGERFAREGIVGRFAVDFIVVRSKGGEWEPYAIEVNLRKGGTTHPFLTLQYLTDGIYHPESGKFFTHIGQEKYYVASDHIESEAYKVFTSMDLFDIVSRHRLHYDQTCQTGIVMHMLSGVGSEGRLGVTAIGDTPEDAEGLYQEFVEVLDREASTWNQP